MPVERIYFLFGLHFLFIFSAPLRISTFFRQVDITLAIIEHDVVQGPKTIFTRKFPNSSSEINLLSYKD